MATSAELPGVSPEQISAMQSEADSHDTEWALVTSRTYVEGIRNGIPYLDCPRYLTPHEGEWILICPTVEFAFIVDRNFLKRCSRRAIYGTLVYWTIVTPAILVMWLAVVFVTKLEPVGLGLALILGIFGYILAVGCINSRLSAYYARDIATHAEGVTVLPSRITSDLTAAVGRLSKKQRKASAIITGVEMLSGGIVGAFGGALLGTAAGLASGRTSEAILDETYMKESD